MSPSFFNHQDHLSDLSTVFDNLYSNVTSPSALSHASSSSDPWNTAAISDLINNTTAMAGNLSTPYDPFIKLKNYTIFRIAYFLNQYYLWVVFAFGFPGNIVSFITILRMKPVTSPTMYVAAVAFMDNTCLVCKILFFTLTKYDAPLGNKGCAAIWFLGSFTAQFANWLLVAMTVERCLAICLPLKVGSICTRKLHVGGLVVTALMLVANNGHLMVTSEMVSDKGDYQCKHAKEFSNFLTVWYWVDGLIYVILPALLLIVMNVLIILGIRRSAKIQRELTNKASQVAEAMRQQRQITVMLVVVCIAFVLLMTPLAIFYPIRQNWTYTPNTFEHAKALFTEQLAFVLADSTHAVNFYLYFFSTRRFRKRCLETVFCCYSARRRNRRFRGSTISGMSKTYRLSVTDVTTVPQNAVQLTNFSSSPSSSSNHLHIGNGDTKMTRMKGVRDGSC